VSDKGASPALLPRFYVPFPQGFIALLIHVNARSGSYVVGFKLLRSRKRFLMGQSVTGSFSLFVQSGAIAIEHPPDSSELFAWREVAANRVAGLSLRQRQIMELVLAGHHSKTIAADLGISQRTVENHRALIMKKTGATSLPALARLALAAAWNGADQRLVQGGPAVTATRRIAGG
jgi:DNA-binding CsgD family transcriptional regulator